jgi:hypothetical protein
MDDGSNLKSLISDNSHIQQQQEQNQESQMVNEILMKIKQDESSSNIQMNQNENQPIQQPMQQQPIQQQPTQQQIPQQPMQQQIPQSGVIQNDPIPNSTINNTIDPTISNIAMENQGHAKNIEKKEEPPSINMFEIPKDVNFSITDLLWKELRGPIIVGLLTFLVLLPYCNVVLQKYIPVIGNSVPFTMTLKSFTVAILYYILTKISLL